MHKLLNEKKNGLRAVLLAGLLSILGSTGAVYADELHSLRGAPELDVVPTAEPMKKIHRDQETIARDYVLQPPLIPHQIRGYRIDKNSNKCLSCHSWKNYKQTGATKISITHFETRDSKQLADVSPLRYFCTQCHVTQADAKPLIKNRFKSVETLNNE